MCDPLLRAGLGCGQFLFSRFKLVQHLLANESRAVKTSTYSDELKSAKPLVQPSRSSVVPFHERITCTVPEACQAIGLGRSKLYELIAEGQLRTTTIGRRRLVLVNSLLTLVSAG